MSNPKPFTGGSVPPDLKDFSGPLFEDPVCYRCRPHFTREYGCRWSHVAIYGADGSIHKVIKIEEAQP